MEYIGVGPLEGKPLLLYCHVILSHDLVVLAANTKVEPLLMASAKYVGVYERDAQERGPTNI